MQIYLINLFSLLIWGGIYYKFKKYPNSKKIIMLLILVQFVLLQGLRDFSVGNDTSSYIRLYKLYDNANIIGIFVNSPYPAIEKGYMLLMAICRFIGLSDRAYLFVISILINSLFFRFIYKESPNPIFSIWLYICLEFFTLSFTAFRQMLAIGLVLNAYLYIKNKNLIKYIILSVVAISVHKSAIFFVFLYLVYNHEFVLEYPVLNKFISFIKKNKYLIYGFVILGFYMLAPQLISSLAKIFYPNYSLDASSSRMTLFFVMIGLLLFSIFIEYRYEINEKNYQYLQLLLFFAICVQSLTSHIQLVGRLSLYFYSFIIIYIPIMISKIKEKKINILFTVAFYGLTFIQYYFFSMDMYNLVPYYIL